MNKHVSMARFRSSAVPPMAELYGALARARGEFPEIPKRRKATVKSDRATYSYMYADLTDIFAAVTEPLATYGLGVWQEPTPKGVVTIVYHESGAEKKTEPFPIKAMKKGSLEDAQSFQAAFQMAKRYSLQAALGISTEESIEGDRSRRVDEASSVSVTSAASQGLKDAWVAGVLDKLPENADDRTKADAFARQIMEDFQSPKSKAGVNGAWNKRSTIIDALDERHNDLFQEVFDAFHARLDELEGE